MANVLYYYKTIREADCGCCSECVVEWELRTKSGKVLVCDEYGPDVDDEAELRDVFCYLVDDYGEFEVHPDNVYL